MIEIRWVDPLQACVGEDTPVRPPREGVQLENVGVGRARWNCSRIIEPNEYRKKQLLCDLASIANHDVKP
jgi:hypothetical protein